MRGKLYPSRDSRFAARCARKSRPYRKGNRLETGRGNGTPRRARRTHVHSPRLASPRHVAPRLASRADTASVKVAVCALNVLFARSLSPPVPGVPSGSHRRRVGPRENPSPKGRIASARETIREFDAANYVTLTFSYRFVSRLAAAVARKRRPFSSRSF